MGGYVIGIAQEKRSVISLVKHVCYVNVLGRQWCSEHDDEDVTERSGVEWSCMSGAA